jgi:hypothetical protein
MYVCIVYYYSRFILLAVVNSLLFTVSLGFLIYVVVFRSVR